MLRALRCHDGGEGAGADMNKTEHDRPELPPEERNEAALTTMEERLRATFEQERQQLLVRAQAAAAQAETAQKQLASIFERVTDAFVALDKDWRYAYVNEKAGELFGRKPQDLLGKHIWTEFPDGVGQPFHLAYERAMAEQKPVHLEDYYAPWNRWFENIIYPSPEGISIYFHDITDRKTIEAELHKRNRALRTLSECNQALVHAPDEPTLLAAICRIVVEIGGYRLAWVGYKAHDEAKTVRPVAQAGCEDAYLETLRITWANTERGRGPAGIATRTGHVAFVRNILTDPTYEPWRAEATKRGYASLLAAPLQLDGETIGVFNVYSDAPDAFDTEEVALLTELSNDLAFGIGRYRTRVENKRADEERQAALQRFADIVEFLPDATFVIDEEKRVIAWNHACETMTGVGKEALLGKGDYAYAEPFFNERRPILVDRLDELAPKAQGPYKYFHREGHVLYAESFVPQLNGGKGAHLWGVTSPLFDKNGRRCGAIEVIRDVTEHKRVELALRDSENQLSLILNNVSDGIFAITIEPNDTLRFTSVNRSFLEGTGLLETQVVGALVQDVLQGPAQAISFCKYHEAIHSRQPVRWEETIDGPKGKRVGLVTVVPVFDATGACTQVVGVVHDITERTKAEEQVRQLNDDLRRHMDALEQRVAERTAQLVAARDMAESADRLKSAFLASMSHELRTPLNSIIGFSGILLQGLAGPLNDEQKKQMRMVCNSSEHLLALINDVLDLSKIESGQLQLFVQSFDLQDLMRHVVGIASPLAGKKGLHLEVNMPPGETLVSSDRRRLEQVLLNLVSNAIKFTDEGRVRIDLSVQTNRVAVCVTDSGMGIKEKDLGSLFRPFTQLDSGTNRRHEGTGLGLSICKRLVDLLGGTIWVKSEWGKGSAFGFDFPVDGGKT